ncbi:MAG: uracil-DNA glycosylase, partial [Propylenella sp.]
MAAETPSEPDPIDLLRFYAEAGVDVALSEAPVDRFAESQAIAAEAALRREAESVATAVPADTKRQAPRAPAPAPQPRKPLPPPALTVP